MVLCGFWECVNAKSYGAGDSARRAVSNKDMMPPRPCIQLCLYEQAQQDVILQEFQIFCKMRAICSINSVGMRVSY